MSRKLTRPLLLACLSLSVGLVGCSREPSAPAEIRVGLVVDTATFAEQPTVNAAKLAVAAVTDAGRLEVGGSRHQVVLLIEGTGNTPEGASRAALKLINQERVVALIGPSISRSAIPVAEVANAARIPMISPGSTHRETTAGKDYVFRVAFCDSFQGQVMARFAAEELGAATAAVLFDVANNYSREIASVFQQVFTATGGRVVAFESYTTGDSDFRDQLLRIRDRRPEVLFLPNFTAEVRRQAKLSRQLGIEAVILGSDGWDPGLLTALPELDGAFLSVHWHPDMGHDNAEARAFIAAYRRAYNQDPVNIAALTYDAVTLLIYAIRSSGLADPEAIRQGLSQIEQFPGVTGPITYRDTGGDPQKQVAIVQLQDGRERLHHLVPPEATR